MCVVILALNVHPDYPLVILNNREEYYHRETHVASKYFVNAQEIIAGRDGSRGGTWLGYNPMTGRVSTLTNYRHKSTDNEAVTKSRGALTTNFLAGEGKNPKEYLQSLDGKSYGGYNLIVGDIQNGLWVASNRSDKIERIEPGVHGLANHLFNSDWPKVVENRTKLEDLLVQHHRMSSTASTTSNCSESTLIDSLFGLLADRKKAPDHLLPNTGYGPEIEGPLSAMFVDGGTYGTRSGTVLMVHKTGTVRFVEKTFDSLTKLQGQVEFHCPPPPKLLPVPSSLHNSVNVPQQEKDAKTNQKYNSKLAAARPLPPAHPQQMRYRRRL